MTPILTTGLACARARKIGRMAVAEAAESAARRERRMTMCSRWKGNAAGLIASLGVSFQATRLQPAVLVLAGHHPCHVRLGLDPSICRRTKRGNVAKNRLRMWG